MTREQSRLTLWTSVCLIIALAQPASGQSGKPGSDFAALARAGSATIRRFQIESASWTVATQIAGGIRFITEVVTTPDARRIVFLVEGQGRRGELARIIQRDGLWYVTEGKKAGKYRPFEAPLDAPTAYLYLARSDLQFVTATDLAGLGTYEGTEDGIATYRSPLPEAMKRQIENLISDWREISRRNPGQPIKPEMAQTLETMKDLLDRGLASRVEIASGMLVEYGTPQRQTRVIGFRWRKDIKPRDLATDGRKWEDFTDDPTTGNRDDLLMIGHSGVWRPGMKSHETDARLLDLETGRYRRIPFQGAQAVPGCFLQGRTRVAISGLGATDGALGLYEIDLKTGANRQLGGAQLAHGFSLFPVLSPDGKTLAVLHRGASEHLLDTQLCLVDLGTGEARPLGKPHDMASPSWLPDGRGLVILVRETVGAMSKSIHTISRMDLNGQLTKLREGDHPVLLGGDKTILFKDAKSETWRTCNLDGGDVKPYGDGLKEYGFPTPAPDGKRLLMMRFSPEKAPEPVVLPIGENKGKPATTVSGLWAIPAWR